MVIPEFSLLMNPHILGVLQAESGQVFNRLGLCGGEEQRLSGFWKVLHNGVECVGKAHV